MKLAHKFVKSVPEKLEDGMLYISMEYATAIHKCCCGCGYEVVTPFSPKDWKLTFDGESISLTPSIGNLSFPCKSHYWIRNSMVQWAPSWTGEEIERVRGKGDRTKNAPHEKKGFISLLKGFFRKK